MTDLSPIASRLRFWFLPLLSAGLFCLPLASSAATPTSTATLDSDGDGLYDVFEAQLGTNAFSKDSDGDSFEDKHELMTGWVPTSSAPVRMKKSVRINIKTQKLEMKVDGITIKTFPVSTGLPKTPTPRGTFSVLNKHPRAWSRSASLWMPYWMAFTGRGHGIHELPEWPGGRKEGQNHLGRPASHGCVRLGIGAAKELYEWSPIGMKILID